MHIIIIYRPTYKSKLIVKIERKSIVVKACKLSRHQNVQINVNNIGFCEIDGGGGACAVLSVLQHADILYIYVLILSYDCIPSMTLDKPSHPLFNTGHSCEIFRTSAIVFCLDVNECFNDNGYCEGLCVNTQGGCECSCFLFRYQ